MTPEKLKQARKDLGWSQAALAEELGLTREMVNLMENGKKPITKRTELAVKALLLERGER